MQTQSVRINILHLVLINSKGAKTTERRHVMVSQIPVCVRATEPEQPLTVTKERGIPGSSTFSSFFSPSLVSPLSRARERDTERRGERVLYRANQRVASRFRDA